MADPWMQPNNKSKYWENMLRKYEKRNARLQSEECELRHKLEALECSLPIMLCMNVMNQSQPISAPINDSEIPIRYGKSPQLAITNTPYCSCTNCAKAAAGECDCGASASKPTRPDQNQLPKSSGSASAPTIQPKYDQNCKCSTYQTASSHSQISDIPQRDEVPERVPQQTVSLPGNFSNEFCPCEDCALLPMGQCDCGVASSNAFCPCEDCELLAQGVCDCGPQNDPIYNQHVPKSGGAKTSKPAVSKDKPFKPCDCAIKKMKKSKSPPTASKPKGDISSIEQEISITNPLQPNEPNPNTTVSSVVYPKSGKYAAPYPQSTQDSKYLKPLNQPVSHPYHTKELPHGFSNDNCDCRKCTLIASAECECSAQPNSTIPPSSLQSQYPNDDLSLLDSEDFLIIDRVKHLAEKEKSLKQNINELYHKENAISEAMEAVQFLKNNPTMNNSGVVEDNQGNIMDNLQRLNDSLLQENTRMSDELADVKLDMKQMKERVEGPMQRELEREKRKNKNIEDDLTRAKEEINRSEEALKKEIDFLKMQLEANAAQHTDLKALNGRLKDELNLMDTKCNELHEELINQKISEANTLSRIKAATAASVPLASINTNTSTTLPQTLSAPKSISSALPASSTTEPLAELLPSELPTTQVDNMSLAVNDEQPVTATNVEHPLSIAENTEDLNEHSNEDLNEDSNEDLNEDSNEDLNEDSNEDSNKDSNEDSNEDLNEDSNEDLNEVADKILDEDAPLDTPGQQDQMETAEPDPASTDIPSQQDHIVNMALIQYDTPDLGIVSEMYASGEINDLIKPELKEKAMIDDVNNSQNGSTTKEVKPIKITTKPNKARVREGNSLNALARDLSDLLNENKDNLNIPKDMKDTAHEIKVLVDVVDKKLAKPQSFGNTKTTKPTTELFKRNLANKPSEELPQEKQEVKKKEKCPCLETVLSLIAKKLGEKWESKVPSKVDDNTKDIVKIGLQPKQLEDEPTEDTEFEDAMDEIPKIKKEMAIEDIEEETFAYNLDPPNIDNINSTEVDLDNTSPLGKQPTTNVVYEEQNDEPVLNVEKDVEPAENITNKDVIRPQSINTENLEEPSSKLKSHGDVSLATKLHGPGKVLKNLELSNEINVETELKADDDVDVNTQVMVVKRNINGGINMTTTLTKSGTLEVITEGPAGIIETTMTLTESGNIEVVTQITDFDEAYDKDVVEDEEETTTDTETDPSSMKNYYDDDDNDRDNYEPGGARGGKGADPSDNSKIRKGDSSESNKKRNNNNEPYTESSPGNPDSKFQNAAIISPQFSDKTILKISSIHKRKIDEGDFYNHYSNLNKEPININGYCLENSEVNKYKNKPLMLKRNVDVTQKFGLSENIEEMKVHLNKMKHEILNSFQNTIDKTKSTSLRSPSSVLRKSNIKVIRQDAVGFDQLTKILHSNKINISSDGAINHKISNDNAMFEEFNNGKINTKSISRKLDKKERKNMLSSIRSCVSLDVTKASESNDFHEGSVVSDYKKIFRADANNSLENSQDKLNLVESKSPSAIAICAIEGYTNIKRKRELEEIKNSDKIKRNTDFSMKNTEIESLYNIALNYSNIVKEKSVSPAREIKMHNRSSMAKAKIVKSDTNSATKVHKYINKFTQSSRAVIKQRSLSDRHLKLKLERQCTKARGDKANILSKKDLKDCEYESNLSDLFSENYSKVHYINSIKPQKEIQVAIVTQPWIKVKLTEEDIQRLNIRTLFQSSSSIEKLIKQYSSSNKNKIQPCCNDITGTYASALRTRNTVDDAYKDISIEKTAKSLGLIDTEKIKETTLTKPKKKKENKKKLSNTFKNINVVTNIVLDVEPKSTVGANEMDKVSKVEKIVELPHGDGLRKNPVLTENILSDPVKSKKYDDEQNIVLQLNEDKLGDSSFDKAGRMEKDIVAVNDVSSMDAMKPEKDSLITEDNKNTKVKLKSLQNKLEKTSESKTIEEKPSNVAAEVSVVKAKTVVPPKITDNIKPEKVFDVKSITATADIKAHSSDVIIKINSNISSKPKQNVVELKVEPVVVVKSKIKVESKPDPKPEGPIKTEIVSAIPNESKSAKPIIEIDVEADKSDKADKSNKEIEYDKKKEDDEKILIVEKPISKKVDEIKENIEQKPVGVPDTSDIILEVSHEKILDNVDVGKEAISQYIEKKKESITEDQIVESLTIDSQKVDEESLLHVSTEDKEMEKGIITKVDTSAARKDKKDGILCTCDACKCPSETENQKSEDSCICIECNCEPAVADTNDSDKCDCKPGFCICIDLDYDSKVIVDTSNVLSLGKEIDCSCNPGYCKCIDHGSNVGADTEIDKSIGSSLNKETKCGCKPADCECIDPNSDNKGDGAIEKSITSSLGNEIECSCKPGHCDCIHLDKAVVTGTGIENSVETGLTEDTECACKPGYCKCTDANDTQDLKEDKNTSECICKVGYCNCEIIEDIHCSCMPGHCECTSDSTRIENYGDMSNDERCTCKVCVCSAENSKPPETKTNISGDTNISAKCICAKCICTDDTNDKNATDLSSVQRDPKTHANGLNCSCNQCNDTPSKVQQRKFEIIRCSCCTCKECNCLPKKTHSFATDTKSDTFEKYKNSTSIDGDQTLLIEINKRQIDECVCSRNACIYLSQQQTNSGTLNIEKENDHKCTCETCSCTQNKKSNSSAKGTSAANKQTSLDQSFARETITTVEPCICAPFDCNCRPIEIVEQPKDLEECTCKPFQCSCDLPNTNVECTCDPLNCLCEEQSTVTVECTCDPNNCSCGRSNKSQPDHNSISTKSSEYVDCNCMDCSCKPDVDNLTITCTCSRCLCPIKEENMNNNCSCSKCDCPIEQISNVPEEIKDCICDPLSCSCDSHSHDKSKECTCDPCNCLCENYKDLEHESNSISVKSSEYADCNCTVCSCMPDLDNIAAICTCETCICSIKEEANDAFNDQQQNKQTINANDCTCTNCECPVEPSEHSGHDIAKECTCDPSHCLCENDIPVISKKDSSTSSKNSKLQKDEKHESNSISVKSSEYVDCNCTVCSCMSNLDNISAICTCATCICSIKEEASDAFNGQRENKQTINENDCTCTNCECPVEPSEHSGHDIAKECTCDPSHCLCENYNPAINKKDSSTSSKNSKLQKDQEHESNSISVKSSEYVDCNCTVCSCMSNLDNISAICTCATCICSIKEEASDAFNGQRQDKQTINENDCTCTNCECPVEPSEHSGHDIAKECTCDPSPCLCENYNPVINKKDSSTSSKNSKLQKDEKHESNSISVKSSEYVDCNCTVCSCMSNLDNISAICTCETCVCSLKEEGSDAFNGQRQNKQTINENDCTCTNCECPVEPSEHSGHDIAKECTCDPSHCLCEEQSINTIECTCDPYNCFCEDHDHTKYKSSKDERNQGTTKSAPIQNDKSSDVNSIRMTRNDTEIDPGKNSIDLNKTDQNSTKLNIQLNFEELLNNAKSGKIVELVNNSSLKLLLSKYVHNAIIINLKEDMNQANRDVLEVIEEANRKLNIVLQRIDKRVEDKVRKANYCNKKRSSIPIYKESSQYSDVDVEEYIGSVMFDNNYRKTHDNEILSEYTSAVSTICYENRNPQGSQSYISSNNNLKDNIGFKRNISRCSKLFLESCSKESLSLDCHEFNSAITNSEFGIPFVNSTLEQGSGLKIDGLHPDVIKTQTDATECDDKNLNIMSNDWMVSKIELNKHISGISTGVKNIFVKTDENFEEHITKQEYSDIDLFQSSTNKYVSNNKKPPGGDIDDSSRIKLSQSHIATQTFFENEKLRVYSNCNVELYVENFNKYCTGDIDHVIAKEMNNHELEVDKNIDLKQCEQIFEIEKELDLKSHKMPENGEQYVKNDMFTIAKQNILNEDVQILYKEKSDTSEQGKCRDDVQQEKMLLIKNLVNNQDELNIQKSVVVLEASKSEDHNNKSRNDLQKCIIESDGSKICNISCNMQNSSINKIVNSSYITFNDGQANISSGHTSVSQYNANNFDSRFINSDQYSEEIIAYIPKLTNRSCKGFVSRIITRKTLKVNSLFKYPIKLSDVKCVYTKINDINAASKITSNENIIATSNHLVSNENIVSSKSEEISYINYFSDQRSDIILTSSDQLLSPLFITSNEFLPAHSNNIIHIREELISVKQNQYSPDIREQSSTRQNINDAKDILKCNPQTMISNFHHVPVLSIIDECRGNAEISPNCNHSKQLDQIDKHGDGDDETDDEWQDALEIIPKMHQTADIVGDAVYHKSIKSMDAKAQTSNVELNTDCYGDIEADHGYSCECIDCLTAPCSKAFATIRSIAEPILECPLCNRIECIGGCKITHKSVTQKSTQDEDSITARKDFLGVTQSDKVYNQCLLNDCTFNVGDGLVENKDVRSDFRSLPCVMNTVIRSNGSTKLSESPCRVPSIAGNVLSFDHYQSIPVRDLYISDVTDTNKSDDDLNDLQNIMKQISSACLKAGTRLPMPLVYYQNPSNPTSVTSLQIAFKNLQAKCHNKDSLMKAMICELQMRFSREFSVPGEFSEIIGQNFNIDMRNIELKECSENDTSEHTNHYSCENIISRKQYNSRSSTNRSRSNRSSSISSNQSTSEKLRNCPSEEVVNVKPLQIIEVKRIGDDSLLVKWKAPVNERILGYEVCVDEEVKTRVYRRTRTMAVITAVPLDSKPIVNISVYACTDKGRCLPAALASFHI